VDALSARGSFPGIDGPVAHVDLGALRHNVTVLRSRLAPGTLMLAAVKADAYGHGAAAVGRALQSFGVDRFGVATAAEALALRAAGVTAPILLFGPVRHGHAALVEAGVALTIPDVAALRTLEAARVGSRASVHVKLDTGMGRLGVHGEDAPALVRAVAESAATELEGLWTHLADSDDPEAASDASHTGRQLARLARTVATLEAAGLRPPLVHAANSAATLVLSASHHDMVRPGIALYGHHASPSVRAAAGEIVPVLTLTAPIVFVKRLRRGDTVGYGASWTAAADTVIATVRIGYADGYPRSLANRGTMRLHGRTVRVAGRVCMDQVMLDVGALGGVEVGDVVTVFGPDGPDAEELAELAGTVSYELLTRLGPRVERTYVEAAAPAS
jgi:alanine racemase